jgi:hypothetical protein
MRWRNWILSVFQDIRRRWNRIGSRSSTQKYLVYLTLISSTHFSTKVWSAVSDLATTESMWLQAATDQHRSSTSSLDRRFASFKMNRLMQLEISISEVYASVPMEDISLPVQKTS